MRAADPLVLEAAAGVRRAAGACADWPALATSTRGCTACPELAATRTTVVVGTAPAGARVLLLGEAPGAQEDASGLPFVGKAGQLLDRLLDEVGLPRASVAVVNVLKCRPPGNRAPTRDEAARCRGWLDRQLELADPAVLVAMGTSAVTAVLGKVPSLAATREAGPRALPGPPGAAARTVLATYHPSAAIRFGPRGAPLAALREDLALAARLSDGGRS